nr:sulfatase-like hydrolase/transferase [bacterium]
GLGRGFDVYDQLLTPDRLHPLIYRTGILAGFTRFHVLRPAERKWFRTVPSVLQWWSRTPAKPRFTWVHFYDPHFPYEPQPEFRKMTWPETPRFDQSVFEIAMMNAQGIHPETSRIEEYKALYHGEVAGVDAAVGHLVRALQQSDRFQDTLIIVAADHGESLDEHDYYFAHGENLYDPSLNVPLLASFPRVIQSRLILPGQTSLNTVPGIIQSVLGIPLSDHDAEYCRTVAIQHEMLRGESPLKALGIKSFCETGAGVYTTAHEPSDDRIRMKKRGIRTHGAKLILDEDGTVSGYDLETDPGETRPGAPEGNNEFMELYGELTEYIRAADPPDRQPVNLPDAEAIRQLRALGYIDE